MYNVSSIFDTITAYGGHTCYIILFAFCLTYCAFTLKQEKKKQMFCIMILSVVCLYNDGVRFLISKFTDLETYYRFLWMIPVIPMLAYCFVDIAFRENKGTKRWIAVILLLTVLFFGGNSYFSDGCFQLPENRYNIPDDVLAVCDLIKADQKTEHPVVVGDVQVQLPIRTYDASFMWGISREAYCAILEKKNDGEEYKTEAVVLQAVMDGEVENVVKLREALEALNIDYLIVKGEYEMDSSLEDVACEKIGDGGKYSVYRFDKEKAAEVTKLEELKNLNIETVELVIPSVIRDYTFLFIADNHVETESEENPEKVKEYAKERNIGFVNANGVTSWEQFPGWMEAANEYNVDAVLMGGDIIDSPSESNLAFLEEQLAVLNMPSLFTPGNHDWTYPWEYMTEKGEEEYLPLLSKFTGNTAFSKMEFPDFVIAAVDNSTDQVNKEALAGVTEVVQEGKPVILLLHVPLSTESLAGQSREVWGNPIVLGEGGIEPNEISQKFLDIVYAKDSPVVAVLAGHVHFRAQENLNENIVQIVSDASFKGNGILLRVHAGEN